MRIYRVNRTVDHNEFHWMHPNDAVHAGDIVYSYSGFTYGCIGDGIAVSRRPHGHPFFEVPRDAVDLVTNTSGQGYR